MLLPPIFSQHRVLHCYLILSVWILLMIADIISIFMKCPGMLTGMYKYIGTDNGAAAFKHLANEVIRGFPKDLKPDIKTRRIFKLCNPPEDILLGSEGQVDENFSLEGILVVMRHGDRGPLTHVRNISSVNCAGDLLIPDITAGDWDTSYLAYEAFLHNASLPEGSNGVTGNEKAAGGLLGQILGPFRSFPLVPSGSGECNLGQLTPVGISQLLRTGRVLRSAYGDRLGVGNGSLTADDIVVFSTNYRRTLQSALAFLYSFFPLDDLRKVTVRSSQSLAFCFNDCGCPAAEKFRRQFTTETMEHFRSHPAVMKLVQQAAAVVYENPDKALMGDPQALRDALLAYVCHGAQLPCVDIATNNKVQEVCVRPDQVTGLFAYTEWEERLYAKSRALKRSCLLRAYGILRNIVSHLLRIVSESRPRVVVYSGHDKTLQYLAGALGVIGEIVSPHYASRLVIEVYRSRNPNHTPRAGSANTTHSARDDGPAAKEYFFRLVFNGRDLTSHVTCCKHGGAILVSLPNGEKVAASEPAAGNLNSTATRTSTASTHHKTSPPVHLCPIESIVRFLHDDYFFPFNATNFKDACNLHP